MSASQLCLAVAACVLLAGSVSQGQEVREFYIMCSEEEWDYAPGGGDKVALKQYNQTSAASEFLEQSSDRIGHKYRKVLYRRYTDQTFDIEIEKPEWLGFVGPIIQAEAGDTIRIYFRNNASRPYSMHPHGVIYDKSSEGAVYSDDAGRAGIPGDAVPPGGTHTYTWTVEDTASPAEGDPDCITWLYHSHVSAVEDVSSGLVGFLMTCRRGTLEKWRETRMYVTYVSVVDENLSWYLDYNINHYANSSAVNKDDDEFKESNHMYAINGYVFGHLPGLTACVGETINWHMAGLGTETDIHSMSVSGHSFEYFNHRVASLRVTVAHFLTAKLSVVEVGKWLVSCQLHGHFTEGMQAFLNVENCNKYPPPEQRVDNIRRYYIAAEEVLWNYAPSGRNRFDGGPLTEPDSDSEVFFKKDASHIGGEYKKVVYQEYTDYTFTTLKPKEEHLGLLGPVLKAEVGDMVKVVFFNKASRPYSVHPQGVYYTKFNDGELYNDNIDGKYSYKLDDYVKPMTIHTYYWTIPEVMGPTPDDPPCLTRMYTSNVDVVRDTYSGLVGPLLVCKRGSLDGDGKQINATKEFFLMFSVTDENESWYMDDNLLLTGVQTDKKDDAFVESNLMHGINGRLYGNLQGLDMCVGDEVRWHVFGVGTDVDLHTLTFASDTFMLGPNRLFSSTIVPGSMTTLDMVPAHQGSWALVCETHDHYKAGMKTVYNVSPCEDTGGTETSLPESARVVRKYIQAEELEWDYIPLGKDNIFDTQFTENNNPGATFVESSATRIGGRYIKALYKEYTDDTFTTQPRNREEYLGILGPVIRVEVGDTLEILFRNRAAVQTYSIKAKGLVYTGPSQANFTASVQPSVAPHQNVTYRWQVSPLSGPGPSDPECITSAYYSDVSPVKDVNSGLIGPLVICRKGSLTDVGGRRVRKTSSVNKDFALYFSVIDENKSWYLEQNIEKFIADPSAVDPADDDFVESNLMHAINGYLYGNQPVPEMEEGNVVDWYLITMGTEVDMHSVHFHGNDLTIFEGKKHTNDVTQLFPSVYMTARMHALNPGKWLFHCHVNDHIHAGMEGLYKVKPAFKFSIAR